ncbi:MAG TPA: hypothetical protein VK841_11740, partial [Polyangiaceae bacterium]|nr:hypothetical protein [Polyangiaceae bacterium]
MTSGLYAQACDQLEESQRLDPGGGTLLNVALCHELQGRIATALSEFNAALALAQRDRREDRVAAAQRHVDSLTPRVPHLAVVVRPAARVPGLVVYRDGVVLEPASWEIATPIDKGEHLVGAKAPGRVDWRTSVHLDEDAASVAVEIPILEPVLETPPPKQPDTPMPKQAERSAASPAIVAP